MSGIFRTLLNVTDGRRIALLERFRVDDFVALVERHRPKAVSLVPTALRMVLDADVDPESLRSIQVVTSGSAALPVAVQEAFESKYGIAVLPSYGATEFAGGVAGWTLPLHREWAERKRGSVGRPQPGRELRIVDSDTGAELPDRHRPGDSRCAVATATGSGPPTSPGSTTTASSGSTGAATMQSCAAGSRCSRERSSTCCARTRPYATPA